MVLSANNELHISIKEMFYSEKSYIESVMEF